MSRAAAAVGPRALSVTAALVFAGGFALYQMTSLVLGPPATRQLQLSVNIPRLDGDDGSEPSASSTTIVLGMLAPAVRVGSMDGRAASSRTRSPARGTPAPTPASIPAPIVAVAPVPTSATRRSEHGRPPVVPTPQRQRDHEPD